MTLGERICAQRTGRGLSQADLAERLEVSRQSISKWETDASVPELDKLVKLCELFDITLDQLVRGETQEEAEETPPEALVQAPPGRITPVRIILGAVLLICGFLAVLLPALRGGLLEGLVLASPFLLCGVICLAVRRHGGLLCGWVWWALLAKYLDYATGIRIWWILSPMIYRPEMRIHLLIAWCIVLTFVALAAATLRLVWKWNKRRNKS